MILRRKLLISITLACVLAGPALHVRGQDQPARYRVSFVLGNVTTGHNGRGASLRKDDYVNEGDILVVEDRAIVELRQDPGDRTFRITGPVVYRCVRYKLARDFSRNSLVYRIYSKLSQDTYHYYPRTVISAVRGEKEADAEARNLRQSEALKEAIDLFRKADLDESLKRFDDIAAQEGLQRHVKYLVDFYRGEIRFMKGEYREAMDLYLAVYKTRNRKFRHREIAHCRAILCAVYSEDTARAGELIGEYGELYGKNGAYSSLMEELRAGMSDRDR